MVSFKSPERTCFGRRCQRRGFSNPQYAMCTVSAGRPYAPEVSVSYSVPQVCRQEKTLCSRPAGRQRRVWVMKSPGILPLVCPSCGGTWFRLTRSGRYRPFTVRSLWLASLKEMPLLVCLCGRPQVPSLSGSQPERESLSLMGSIDAAREAGPAAALERSRLHWWEQHANLADFPATTASGGRSAV
jgi:hypothetical protein